VSELVVGSLRGVATATNQDARQVNRRATLRALASGEAHTRADLARVTGLARPTISSLVAELVDDGLVVEVGTGTSAGGKPPTLLEVDHTARQVIAVDISRRPVVATLSNLAGEVAQRETAGAATTSGHELLEVVANLVQRLVDAATAPVAGIGIGTPGLVGADGVVIEAPNLDWHGVPLAKELSRRTGLPTWVDNDADAAALAEYGALPPDRDGLVGTTMFVTAIAVASLQQQVRVKQRPR
jgi:DNA-binding transcriptional ArsR family regulator